MENIPKMIFNGGRRRIDDSFSINKSTKRSSLPRVCQQYVGYAGEECAKWRYCGVPVAGSVWKGSSLPFLTCIPRRIPYLRRRTAVRLSVQMCQNNKRFPEKEKGGKTDLGVFTGWGESRYQPSTLRSFCLFFSLFCSSHLSDH